MTPNKLTEEVDLGKDIGEILADFENDHDEERAVRNIFGVIDQVEQKLDQIHKIREEEMMEKARRETAERIIGDIPDEWGTIWNPDDLNDPIKKGEDLTQLKQQLKDKYLTPGSKE